MCNIIGKSNSAANCRANLLTTKSVASTPCGPQTIMYNADASDVVPPVHTDAPEFGQGKSVYDTLE
jgi:hypothetical protein